MGLKAYLAIAGLSLASMSGCYHPAQLYSDLGFRKMEKGDMMLPEKKSLENLLEMVWNSGFIVQSDRITEEILDNKYGIFTEGNEPKGCGGCLSIYISPANFVGGEVVLLKESLFTQELKISGTRKGFKAPSSSIASCLVHELFHDFWDNLASDKTKSEFSSVARWLYGGIESAKTDDGKIEFLLKIGANPSVKEFEGYAEILGRRQHYGEGDFFGKEMHSIIAELAYERSIIVPRQMKRFYAGLISREELGRK